MSPHACRCLNALVVVVVVGERSCQEGMNYTFWFPAFAWCVLMCVNTPAQIPVQWKGTPCLHCCYCLDNQSETWPTLRPVCCVMSDWDSALWRNSGHLGLVLEHHEAIAWPQPDCTTRIFNSLLGINIFLARKWFRGLNCSNLNGWGHNKDKKIILCQSVIYDPSWYWQEIKFVTAEKLKVS